MRLCGLSLPLPIGAFIPPLTIEEAISKHSDTRVLCIMAAGHSRTKEAISKETATIRGLRPLVGVLMAEGF